MKRFLMNNPGNEAWIKSQEKVHEATLVSQARSKPLRNSMYPELSVVHAQIATHSPMMADLSEQCWWKGVPDYDYRTSSLDACTYEGIL
jgi:hypothetical protein